jgi:hypothetical protein
MPGEMRKSSDESKVLRKAADALHSFDESELVEMLSATSPTWPMLQVAKALVALFNLGRGSSVWGAQGHSRGEESKAAEGGVDAALAWGMATKMVGEIDFVQQLCHFHLEPVSTIEQYIWAIATCKKLEFFAQNAECSSEALTKELKLARLVGRWIHALYTFAAAVGKVAPRMTKGRKQRIMEATPQLAKPKAKPEVTAKEPRTRVADESTRANETKERHALCIVATHACGWKFTHIVKNYSDSEVTPSSVNLPPALFRRLKLMKKGGSKDNTSRKPHMSNAPTPQEAAQWRRYWQLRRAGGVIKPLKPTL